jgi:hypothetical protein
MFTSFEFAQIDDSMFRNRELYRLSHFLNLRCFGEFYLAFVFPENGIDEITRTAVKAGLPVGFQMVNGGHLAIAKKDQRRYLPKPGGTLCDPEQPWLPLISIRSSPE